MRKRLVAALTCGALLLGGGVAIASSTVRVEDHPCPGSTAPVWQENGPSTDPFYMNNGDAEFVCGVPGAPGPAGATGPAGEDGKDGKDGATGPAGTFDGDVSVNVTDFRSRNCHTTVVVEVIITDEDGNVLASDEEGTRFGGCHRPGD